MPLVRNQLKGRNARAVFIDDGDAPTAINGCDVVDWPGFLALDAAEKSVYLAVAASQVRERLADRCAAASIPLFEARADNIVQMDDVQIGPGACLSPFVTLTSNIRIGRCFHANLYSYVAHDCIIGDFVTFAPAVRCNGNVVIEDHAYIGTGAILRQGKPGKPLVIGRGVIVGMGAVVTRDVPAGATVIGNPARPMVRQT